MTAPPDSSAKTEAVRYRLLLNCASDAVLVPGARGRLFECSARARQPPGYSVASTAGDAIHALHARGVPIAIVTRNCRRAARLTKERLDVPPKPLLAREDAAPKPDPAALLAIAAQRCLPPARCAYVGDFRFDVEAAERAGMTPILYVGRRQAANEYVARAAVLSDYRELLNPEWTCSAPWAIGPKGR